MLPGEPAAWALLAAQVVAVAFFSWIAYRKGWLTVEAAAAALALGAAIVVSTNVLWLLVLLSLLAFTSLATRFRYQEKQARGTAEAKGGARRVKNVLANGLAPTLVAAATPLLLGLGGAEDWAHIAALTFLSAVAAAGADTMASELGGLSDRVYLITTLRRVPPGTDGGVSVAGQGAAILGAGLITATGALLLGIVQPLLGGPALQLTPLALAIPVLAGFAGCQVDSLLGATLELRGLVNKEEVNLLGITAGAALGFALGVFL
jgi:uncharacterized protein (TIGR00297 family)